MKFQQSLNKGSVQVDEKFLDDHRELSKSMHQAHDYMEEMFTKKLEKILHLLCMSPLI